MSIGPRTASRPRIGDRAAGDVIDPGFCRNAVERTVEEFGQLDILLNNAAFQEHTDSIEDLTDEHFDLPFKTNVYGTFYMTRAAMPHLGTGSSIINPTSCSTTRPRRAHSTR